jgi:hypothetical protein
MIIDGLGWRTDRSGRRPAHPVGAREADPEPSAKVAARSLVVVSRTDHDRVHGLTVVVVAGCLLAAVLAVFGLPPVDIHGPTHYVGIMDPLCGMTRGVRLLALGDVRRAVDYNPASPLLALFGILMVGRVLLGHLTRRWLEVRPRLSPTIRAVCVVLVAALWINQQAHASLLMHA